MTKKYIPKDGNINRVNNITDLFSLTGVFDNALVYVDSLRTLYHFHASSGAIIDNTKVLATPYGGDTRWVGVAGLYNYYGGGGSSTVWSGTYAELKLLVDSNSLVPLSYYIINNYQTIHKLLETSVVTYNVNVATIPTESILLQAITTSTFDVTAISIDHPYEEADYDFNDDYVYDESGNGSIDWNASSGNHGNILVTRLSSNSFSTNKRIGVDKGNFNLLVNDGTNSYIFNSENYGVDYTVINGIDISTFTIISPINLNSLSASLFQEEYVPYGIRYRNGYLKNRRNLKKKFYDICDYRAVIAARYGIDHNSVPLWNNSTTYSKDTLVRQGNALYACLIDGCLNQQPGLTGGTFFWIRVALSGYTDSYKYIAYREDNIHSLGGYELPVDPADVIYCFRLCNPDGTQLSEGEFQMENTCKNVKINEPRVVTVEDGIDGNVFYQPTTFTESEFGGYGNTTIYNIRESKINSAYGCLIARSDNSEILGNSSTYHDDAQDSIINKALFCIFIQTQKVKFDGGNSSRMGICRQCSIGLDFTNNSFPKYCLNNTIGVSVFSNHFYDIDGCIIEQRFNNNIIGAEVDTCKFGAGITGLNIAFGSSNITNISFLRSNATTAERLASPAVEGITIWDTDLKKYFIHNGTSWEEIVGGTPGLIPSYTTAQRLALSPSAGQQVFDTDLSSMFFFSGTSWEAM